MKISPKDIIIGNCLDVDCLSCQHEEAGTPRRTRLEKFEEYNWGVLARLTQSRHLFCLLWCFTSLYVTYLKMSRHFFKIVLVGLEPENGNKLFVLQNSSAF